MPRTKIDSFKAKEIKLSQLAKALSHPARVSILKTLAKCDECVCGEIVDSIPLAQATVSQHLKELKNIGLIQGEIDGPRSCYCLDPKVVEEFSTLLNEFLSELKNFRSSKC